MTAISKTTYTLDFCPLAMFKLNYADSAFDENPVLFSAGLKVSLDNGVA